MGNFVNIITHNGMKIAFRTEEELNDYIAKNDIKKVKVTLIQYYKDKEKLEKPIRVGAYELCPNCTGWLLLTKHPSEVEIKPNYCPFCGKAIDRSE